MSPIKKLFLQLVFLLFMFIFLNVDSAKADFFLGLQTMS